MHVTPYCTKHMSHAAFTTIFGANRWVLRIKTCHFYQQGTLPLLSPLSFLLILWKLVSTKWSTPVVPIFRAITHHGFCLRSPGANVGIHDEPIFVSQNLSQQWERVCIRSAHGGFEMVAWFLLLLKWLLKYQFWKRVFHQTKTVCPRCLSLGSFPAGMCRGN